MFEVKTRLGCAILAGVVFSPTANVALAAEDSRRIEEVIVTAERQESSVQDTSISITAFTSEMLDDFGIRNQSDLQNMIPATTIQPYDAAIRGVGRNFRNLGGDPGIATYMNNVYSEDLYTATIQSFWDVDRIEILRGPQGTLYGRNAVGGAMNFLYKKPTDQFEMSLKTVLGTYGTADAFGMVSGPVIDGILNARATVSHRRHDGWVEEKGPVGPDLDGGDELNLTLSLEWNITDDMVFNVRSNRIKVNRTFGGGNGGGLIMLDGENSILPGNDRTRNYDVNQNQVRPVDASITNPMDTMYIDPSMDLLTYTNPTTGAPILAQRVRPGIDNYTNQNHGRTVSGVSNTECLFLDRENIKGDDLCAFTNGLNVEEFDQEGVQAEFTWDISDALTFKYIFGYNQLMYQRITEDDSTASQIDDRQFYVNHEAEYASNEFQLFWDVGENLTFTSGLFLYQSYIDQRYDFYSSTSNPQYVHPESGFDNILATVAPGAVPGDPPLTFLVGPVPIGVYGARDVHDASGNPAGSLGVGVGPWLGDSTLGGIDHGIVTPGSDLLGANRSERDAFAAYTQGVWDINDKFTLTAGVRYAMDELDGQENYTQYAQTMGVLDAFGINLATANIIRGALDPTTLKPTGDVPLWLGGTPISFGLHRGLYRKDEKVTGRLNLDYNISDDTMVYGNITSGYRSGGFNLTFFSQTPEFEPEELVAYELGYKTQLFDNSLQFNASIYVYDYSSIHTRTEEACPPGGTLQSAQSACAIVDTTTSVQAAGGAEIYGMEFEVLWLVTDSLTMGGNFSYTDSEYTESFFIVDGASSSSPSSLYGEGLVGGSTGSYPASEPDRRIDVKGNQLLQVPETKANAYASYNFSIGDGNLDLLASWSYISDVYFSAYRAKEDLAPAYDRIDLRATWSNSDRSFIVAGFVNNVTDDIGIRQILRSGSSEGFRRTAQVTEPRMFGVELTYNLN